MDVECKYCVTDGILMNRCRVNLPDDSNLSQSIIDVHCLRGSYCRCCGKLDYFEFGRQKGLPGSKSNFYNKKKFYGKKPYRKGGTN